MFFTKPSSVLHITSKKVTLLTPNPEGIYSPANVKTYSLKSSLFSGKDNPRQRDLSSLSLLSTLKSTKPLHTTTVSVPVVTLGLSTRGVVESIHSVNQVSMIIIDALVAVSSYVPGLALYVKDSRSSEVRCVSSLSVGCLRPVPPLLVILRVLLFSQRFLSRVSLRLLWYPPGLM